jgi:hypothetical protein
MKPKFFVEVVPTVPSDLVSVKEGAKLARKSERAIWRSIRLGKLRAWGTRRCYLISVSELLAPVMVHRGVIGSRGAGLGGQG